MNFYKIIKTAILYLVVSLWPDQFNHKRRWRTLLHHLGQQTRESKNHWWVQVGANDGGDWDPFHVTVRKHALTALVIEPVDFLFHKLKASYQACQARITFEQVAIRTGEGELWMETIDPNKVAGMQEQATKINSLKTGVIQKHASALHGLSDYIIRKQVKVRPLTIF